MLSWFRVHAGRIAVTAIIALTSVGLSAVSPHVDDCHDAGCLAFAVDHDAAAHVIAAPPTADDAPLHCLVCHLVRSFRLGAEAHIVSTPAADVGTAIHVRRSTPLEAALAAKLPARAPPSFPVEA
ncbi:MAG: hypothetical protein O2930_09470 [Acidobacteria bacterium]|nr:hypothetical protein [Acidobacteriota bacterium]